jgi:hypothetical protein
VKDFGREIAHAAVSRRPPIPLDTIVARTHMYTYAAKDWDLSIVQGTPFTIFCRPEPNPNVTTFSSLYKSAAEIMYPRSLPAEFLYTGTPIRCRFEVSLFKPSLKPLTP